MTVSIPLRLHARHRKWIPLFTAGMTVLVSNTWLSSAFAQHDADTPASYEVTADLDGEAWRNMRHNPGNRFLGHGMLTLSVNGDTALSMPGLNLYGSVLFTNGQLINEGLAGTAQGISNIEAPKALRLYETWAEWLYGNSNSIKFGLYDANSEFDAIETAGLFINPSHGIGPDFSQSGLNGPSIFPTTSLGLRSWHQRGVWTVQFAALDGVPGDPEHETRNSIRLGKDDGLLLLAETGIATESGFRVAAGYWHYTAQFDDVLAVNDAGDPIQRDDNSGYYALLDTRLRAQQNEQPGLNAYLRYGKANADINPIQHYLGAGLVISGVLPGRNADQLGLAVGIATAGDAFRLSQANQDIDTSRTERITELTYYLPVNAWLALQPDIQYVQHAGFDASVDNTWVMGVRFTLTTGFRR